MPTPKASAAAPPAETGAAPPDVPGRCHLCGYAELVRYCDTCGHWFCEGCRDRYFDRGLEAIKELIGGRRPNCCGKD